jgi:hypothetical protein
MGDMRSRRVVLLGLVELGGVGRRLRGSLTRGSFQALQIPRRRQAEAARGRKVGLSGLARMARWLQ